MRQNSPLPRDVKKTNQPRRHLFVLARSHTGPLSQDKHPVIDLPDYKKDYLLVPSWIWSWGRRVIKDIEQHCQGHSKWLFKTLTSKKRLSVKRKYPAPDSIHTKSLKLDLVIKSKLPKQGKDVDVNLAHLQAQVLNVANPLVSLLESALRGLLIP